MQFDPVRHLRRGGLGARELVGGLEGALIPSVELNGNRIKDWPTFYRCAAETFNAPEIAGLMRAEELGQWLGLFLGVEADGSIPRFGLGPSEDLRIEVEDTERFSERAPEVLSRMVWGLGWLNRRLTMTGNRPRVLAQFR